MKLVKWLYFFMIFSTLVIPNAFAENIDLDPYFSSFDYAERKAMKIDSREAAKRIKAGTAQLVDIRFKEEFAAWRMEDAVNIPLNELPGRIKELDKSKLIITACPHKDRAAIARLYLTTKGFQSRYLVDGLIGLAEYLRGDRARAFMSERR